MLNTIRYAILLSLMVFYSTNSFASHAAGLDLTYQCIGGSTYLVTLKFYRECGGIGAPNGDWESYSGDTYLDVFSPSTGLTASLALMETANSGNEITPICPGYNTNCNGGWIPGMQEYIYEGILGNFNMNEIRIFLAFSLSVSE